MDIHTDVARLVTVMRCVLTTLLDTPQKKELFEKRLKEELGFIEEDTQRFFGISPKKE